MGIFSIVPTVSKVILTQHLIQRYLRRRGIQEGSNPAQLEITR